MSIEDDPLATPVQFVRGVGEQRAELFSRLGIVTVRDLLFTMPRDVLDFTQISAVFELNSERPHTVRGEVVDRDSRLISGGRTITAVLLKADGGYVRGTWFNQPYMMSRFQLGQAVLFSGQPKLRDKRWEFSHPRVQWLETEDAETTPGILPRYSLTEGLTMHDYRRAARAATEKFADDLVDVLPDEFRSSLRLCGLRDAIRGLHTPQTLEQYEAGRFRLIYDDLLEFQLGLALRRRYWQRDRTAMPLPSSAKIDARIRRLFPFQFTNGQNRAVVEILKDLAEPHAMHRLLQADVGAGKTAIALYAMLVAIANRAQTALMAPTELLAQQHWQTVDHLLRDSRVRRRLLAGQLTAKTRQTVLDEIASGEADLIVGTQAIIQQDVRFARLGLAVVDEQHKFGVGQRSRFSTGQISPHLLVMTATPIPRSLCLTQFGDLDLTIVSELPPGRQPIQTSRVDSTATTCRMWQFIRKKLDEGRQLYVVCPRIESSDEAGEAVAAEAVFRELQQEELQGRSMALIHGQMPREFRQQQMEAFRDQELQILVSTTVIEVGVDVPNATMMVIYQAERFGLSQLHQLRGRIGRGRFQGFCFLLTSSNQPDAVRRLQALEDSADGFAIAEADFDLRGPGDVLGTRQHGALPLRVANLARDREILESARQTAFELVATEQLDQPEFLPLKIRVLERFRTMMDLPQTG